MTMARPSLFRPSSGGWSPRMVGKSSANLKQRRTNVTVRSCMMQYDADEEASHRIDLRLCSVLELSVWLRSNSLSDVRVESLYELL